MTTVLIRWLIFLHILSALTFYMAHGVSATMAFKIRKETDFARIRAMLDLSESTLEITFVSFLVLGLTGLALPFFIDIWNKVWVWLSIILMVFVFVYMVMFNEISYKQLRRLVGLPSSPEEVAAILNKTNVTGLVVVGYVIPAIVLWLMVFKPF